MTDEMWFIQAWTSIKASPEAVSRVESQFALTFDAGTSVNAKPKIECLHLMCSIVKHMGKLADGSIAECRRKGLALPKSTRSIH